MDATKALWAAMFTVALVSPGAAQAGTLFASDGAKVRAYDSIAQPQVADLVIGGAELGAAGGVAVGTNGNLFVMDRDDLDVLEYNTDGTFVGVFIDGAALDTPLAMTFGPGGDLYIVDQGTFDQPFVPGVYRFNGATGASKGRYTSGKDLPTSLAGLAFDSSNRLYLSDGAFGTTHVHRFDALGGFLSTVISDRDEVPADLVNLVRGLCFDDVGTLLLVDHSDGQIRAYDLGTDTVTEYAPASNSPSYCAVDEFGTLFVTVFGAKGIQPLLADTGSGVEAGTRFATDLGTPLYLAYSPGGFTTTTVTTSSTSSNTSGSSTSTSTTSTTLGGDCGNGSPDGDEECDEGLANSDDDGAWCGRSCLTTHCGQPVSRDALNPVSSDALFALRASVDLEQCDVRVCDVTGDGEIFSGDALVILRATVGLGDPLVCSGA